MIYIIHGKKGDKAFCSPADNVKFLKVGKYIVAILEVIDMKFIQEMKLSKILHLQDVNV